MRIEGLTNYQRRHLRGNYFQDLPALARESARRWLDRFVARCRARGRPLKPWLFALYVGQAKRLALHPPGSEWGRRMRARKGGLAVQRKYWQEGRDPTARATQVRLLKSGAQSQATGEGNARSPDKPPFATNPVVIRGSSPSCPRPNAENLAKQISERVQYVLSCDDRLQQGVGPLPSPWEWEVWLAPVP